MSIGWLWYRLKATPWKIFFKKNGPGEVTWKKWTGFREMPNQMSLCAHWAIRVEGGNRPRAGCYYYQMVTVPSSDPSMYSMDKVRQQAKQAEAEGRVMTYADPECRCRDGFHWKCGLHRTWAN